MKSNLIFFFFLTSGCEFQDYTQIRDFLKSNSSIQLFHTFCPLCILVLYHEFFESTKKDTFRWFEAE